MRPDRIVSLHLWPTLPDTRSKRRAWRPEPPETRVGLPRTFSAGPSTQCGLLTRSQSHRSIKLWLVKEARADIRAEEFNAMFRPYAFSSDTLNNRICADPAWRTP